jgi:hypothetical protein
MLGQEGDVTRYEIIEAPSVLGLFPKGSNRCYRRDILPTKRSRVLCVTVAQALVAAGGSVGSGRLAYSD